MPAATLAPPKTGRRPGETNVSPGEPPRLNKLCPRRSPQVACQITEFYLRLSSSPARNAPGPTKLRSLQHDQENKSAQQRHQDHRREECREPVREGISTRPAGNRRAEESRQDL